MTVKQRPGLASFLLIISTVGMIGVGAIPEKDCNEKMDLTFSTWEWILCFSISAERIMFMLILPGLADPFGTHRHGMQFSTSAFLPP